MATAVNARRHLVVGGHARVGARELGLHAEAAIGTPGMAFGRVGERASCLRIVESEEWRANCEALVVAAG
jgi:hypothetical protein